MALNNSDFMETENFYRLSNLINSIESNLKQCTKKYRDKQEIEQLFSNLNVIALKSNHVFL